MKIVRVFAFALAFVVVLLGWVFVIGILRYGSVEDFGLRMRRAVAWSRPPASYTIPAPENYVARATAVGGVLVSGDLVEGDLVSGDSVASATITSTPTEPPATESPEHQVTDTPEHQVTESPEHQVTESPEHQITDTPATETPNHQITETPVTQTPTTASLTGLRHEWQTWNNCGPATLATYLSYYGGALTQSDFGGVLRRSEDDKNVSPEELQEFALQRGMTAHLRVNGSAQLLGALVSAGYPVLIETWLEEHPNDGMGHYRLVTGYDDTQGAWILYDSYVSTKLVQGGAKGSDPGSDSGSGDGYAGIWLDYATADAWWKVFNRTFLLVYPPADEAAVQAILAGAGMGDALSAEQWHAAEITARAEITLNAQDAFAWFNLGTSLWNQGNAADAAQAFDQARSIGLPWRMLWYQFAPFPAYLEVGRPNDTLTLADATLANTTSIEEIHYWRGRALEALGNPEGARLAYQSALTLYPDYVDAQTAISSLP